MLRTAVMACELEFLLIPPSKLSPARTSFSQISKLSESSFCSTSQPRLSSIPPRHGAPLRRGACAARGFPHHYRHRRPSGRSLTCCPSVAGDRDADRAFSHVMLISMLLAGTRVSIRRGNFADCRVDVGSGREHSTNGKNQEAEEAQDDLTFGVAPSDAEFAIFADWAASGLISPATSSSKINIHVQCFHIVKLLPNCLHRHE
jgi:hypothetical protein